MSEPWTVTLVDTGDETMTGGRLARVRQHIDDTFCFTYGDGLSDVNLTDVLRFHRQHGRKATLTAVQPPGRFGAVELQGPSVTAFAEKPAGDGSWINGGFFVLEPEVIDLVAGDDTVWEREPLEALARHGQLVAYKHTGFWQPMDTLRDKILLENLWNSGRAPWCVWR